MINGQDALLAVAFLLKKEARHENAVASDLTKVIDITYPRASFMLRLMFNKGYIAHQTLNGRTLISLTPKACARVRQINAHRAYLEEQMKLVDNGVFA